MKKVDVLIAVVCLLLSFAGCSAGGKQNDDQSKTRLGLSVYATDDVDEDEASVTAVIAAVLTDDDGVILACRLDEIEVGPKITNGKLQEVTDFRTKGERGNEYGMKAAGAKQEWFEQAEAFCKYVVGKTANEVAGIETKDGKPTDTDLNAGCTIDITDFMAAVSEAAKDAKEYAVSASDKLGIAVTASRYAESDDTQPRYDFVFSAVSVSADGKLTGCAVDELQKTFPVAGNAFTENTEAADRLKTKKQLGDDYGMKAASGIGKEWKDQAEHLAQYLTGKSSAEITEIPLKDGKPIEADLVAGCTISVTGMLENVQKAMKNAA